MESFAKRLVAVSGSSTVSSPAGNSLKDLKNRTFDYIIVGGGTAGSLIASRLSRLLPSSQVLLVEAGSSSYNDLSIVTPGKYMAQLSTTAQRWGYKSIPQKELNNREITFLFNKTLAGSSANNFMGWAKGPEDDWNHWAELVGDDSWRWDNVLSVMKGLEDFDPGVPQGMEKYVSPDPELHGKGGPIGIGFQTEWIPGIDTFIDACAEVGIEWNGDGNSGDPMGASVGQTNIKEGERITSAAAFLASKPENLTITTETHCSKLLFNKEKQAVGVELFHSSSPGEKSTINLMPTGEIILSAGTFGTPKILLLSGIGSPSSLKEHGIPVVTELPGVGKNIMDHNSFSLEYLQHPHVPGQNALFQDPVLLKEAEEQYEMTRTGPLVAYGGSFALAFFKLPAVFESKEFKQLSQEQQEYLRNPRRPMTEVWKMSGPLYYDGELGKDESVLAHEMLLQNCLSRGELKLASTDPMEPPVIDMRYLSHPYDLRLAIETCRKSLEIGRAAAYSKHILKPLHVPESEDDEGIENFARANMNQAAHAMGSCQMGKEEDVDSVVDARHRLKGVKGVRIADLSVCPVLTNNHTQVNVYVIAEKCVQAVMKGRGSRK